MSPLHPLTVAVAQPHTEPYDVAANAGTHANLVRAAAARVVVFPELSLTGYHFDAPTVDPSDPRLEPLVVACADTDSVALAGAPVAGDHIGMLALSGTGATVAYRKQYLGSAERARFVAGPGPVVFEVDGWRLGLAICRDTSVPQHIAATAALGIDAYVAGVLHSTAAEPLEVTAPRLAVDHGVWVAVASFAGSTGEGFDDAVGRSGIWRPDGTVVSQAGSEPGDVVRATFTAR